VGGADEDEEEEEEEDEVEGAVTAGDGVSLNALSPSSSTLIFASSSVSLVLSTNRFRTKGVCDGVVLLAGKAPTQRGIMTSSISLSRWLKGR